MKHAAYFGAIVPFLDVVEQVVKFLPKGRR